MDDQIARPLLEAASPFQPDSVDSPHVIYGSGSRTRLMYPTRDEAHFVRMTFDRFDALRVCRGEYPPYPVSNEKGTWSSICTVESSRWQRERYEYELEHYGKNGQYAGTGVSEMLDEFEHFLFLFHDQFVEVIAGGVCFEISETPFTDDIPVRRLGLEELPETFTIDRFEEHGIAVQMRKDPRPLTDLVAASRLCEQSLFQIMCILDGVARTAFRLTVRSQRGKITSRLRGGFWGGVEATFDGVMDDARTLRPSITKYLAGVAMRRREIAKR